MYLAYFDESGDSGLKNSPTKFFVLSCVLVHQDQWLNTLNKLIHMRRLIRDKYGISTRPEIKATDIRKGRGPLTPQAWSLAQRMDFFSKLMKYQPTYLTDLICFSVAIDKQPAHLKGWEPREAAWKFAIQRVDRFCKDKDDKAMIFPDEGHGPLVKRMVRRIRRHHQVPSHFGQGMLSVPSERVIEDPNDRHSHDSYFIQLADWNAYACHRSSHVDPTTSVPGDLWDELGDCRLLAVNSLTGGPPGIVHYSPK